MLGEAVSQGYTPGRLYVLANTLDRLADEECRQDYPDRGRVKALRENSSYFRVLGSKLAKRQSREK